MRPIIIILSFIFIIFPKLEAQVFTPGDFNDGIYVKENAVNR